MKRTSILNKSIHGFPIEIALNIDGRGESKISTNNEMFNHFLQLFSKHGDIDLDINCKPDMKLDDHHLVDEVAMNLGLAFKEAIEKEGISVINRYGFFILPMDEALATCAVDFCGRSSFSFDIKFNREKLGDLSTEMIREFWSLFSQKAEINFIAKSEFGINDHHVAEALFKCAARAIKMAVTKK